MQQTLIPSRHANHESVTVYVRLLFLSVQIPYRTGEEARHELLQPRQAQFLCRDSEYCLCTDEILILYVNSAKNSLVIIMRLYFLVICV